MAFALSSNPVIGVLLGMSYGYMIFSKTPSVLLTKSRKFNFRPMVNRGCYKVYFRMYENTRGGLIDRDGEIATISIEGSTFFEGLYKEIGQFFLMYFLLLNREGEEDKAEKMHFMIENKKYVRNDLIKDTSIVVNVPHLIRVN